MWTVRDAHPDELDFLREIERRAGLRFEELDMGEVAAFPPRPLPELRSALEAGLLWVADVTSVGATGFALARRLTASLHLEELSVLPAHGRRGIGAGLVRHVAESAAALGYRRVTLATFRDVPWNGPFYERLGFRALADNELSDELMAVRRAEAEAGLAVDERVIMTRRSRLG